MLLRQFLDIGLADSERGAAASSSEGEMRVWKASYQVLMTTSWSKIGAAKALRSGKVFMGAKHS